MRSGVTDTVRVELRPLHPVEEDTPSTTAETQEGDLEEASGERDIEDAVEERGLEEATGERDAEGVVEEPGLDDDGEPAEP